MVVEDRAGIIDSEDGSVLLYQFTLDPNTNTVSNFKFTNNAKAPDTPLKAIGALLGGKDHASVNHGVKKIENELKTDEALNNTVNIIKKKINPI